MGGQGEVCEAIFLFRFRIEIKMTYDLEKGSIMNKANYY